MHVKNAYWKNIANFPIRTLLIYECSEFNFNCKIGRMHLLCVVKDSVELQLKRVVHIAHVRVNKKVDVLHLDLIGLFVCVQRNGMEEQEHGNRSREE